MPTLIVSSVNISEVERVDGLMISNRELNDIAPLEETLLS